MGIHLLAAFQLYMLILAAKEAANGFRLLQIAFGRIFQNASASASLTMFR